MSDKPIEKGDAATRAVTKLIVQRLLDPFQRYNIAQVIREEYAAEAIPRAQIEALEAEIRNCIPPLQAGTFVNKMTAKAYEDCANGLHTLLHPELKGEDKP